MSRPEHDIMLGQDSQSESENGTRHHVHTSRGKYSAYFLKGWKRNLLLFPLCNRKIKLWDKKTCFAITLSSFSQDKRTWFQWPSIVYYHFNNYLDKCKTFTIKWVDITVIIVSDWSKCVDLFKISSMMSQFQPIKEHICVVFCLLLSIIVDQQHQVYRSIIPRSKDMNTKQLS